MRALHLYGCSMDSHDALWARLAQRGTMGRTEADIQSDVKLLLLAGGLDLADDDLDVRLEARSGRGRIDIEIGCAVIETKRDLRRGDTLSNAVDQLGGYVRQRTTSTGQRYVGILTDGHDWHLYSLDNGALVSASHVEIRNADDGSRLLSWLSTILATTRHVPAIPAEIDRLFGADSPAHDVDMIGLGALWQSNATNTELLLKKELWGKLLRTALGENAQDDVALFLRHTYLVITAELIAHEVLGVNISTLSPVDLVSGRAFHDAGVYGVVESDFFDWPATLPGGEQIVRAIARRVGQIDWSDTEHDLLKHLYESVITAEQRHSLGEYYTPDWLAEAVVETVVDDPAQQRIADVACGSGTFVFHAARAVLNALDNAGTGNRGVLAHLTTHVLGMDVHPVAVTLARVTYLLAIGTKRLNADRGDVSVPIYLGDSVQWQISHSILNADGIAIPTSDGKDLFAANLFFPAAAMTDPARFDRLIMNLVDKATDRIPGKRPFPSIKQLLKGFNLTAADHDALTQTFELLCDLHDHHRNHIWGYYIRNLARPRWLTRSEGKVDRIVGNPPWLSYRFMDSSMQKVFQTKSKERNIWAGGRLSTQHDLAAYFVVRACELYLRDGGAFGMVMPNATLSRKPAAGFRKGLWGNSGTAEFTAAWDLDAVRPHIFPVPACVVLGNFQGVDATQSVAPLATTEKWSGHVESSRWRTTRSDLTRAPVRGTISTSSGHRSRYGSTFIQGATIVPRVLHVVERVATTGTLGLPAGLVTVRSSRSNLEKGVWKSLPSRGPVAVEEACVRAMHLGSTLVPFRMLEPWQIVLPIDPRDGHLMDVGDAAADTYPRTAIWWKESVALWDQHGKGSMTLIDRVDFQRTLRAQLPASPTRLVYTKSGTRLAAAIVRDSTAIIDHALYWAAVGEQEGRYLEAVLNARVTQAAVEPYQSRGQLGARHFDMYVWQLPIPLFDPRSDLHTELADLSRQAEQEAATVDVAGKGFQKARGLVRSHLDRVGLGPRIEGAASRLLEACPTRPHP